LAIAGEAPTTAPTSQPTYELVGKLETPAIRESSGVVASRRFPGVFWTHNDSGNPAVLYAITLRGKLIAEFPVSATNTDWEDIAIDDQGRIYLADIGNNLRNRMQVQVYRLPEPDPRGQIKPIVPDKTFQLTFPSGAFDTEGLFLVGDYAFIISKHLDGTHPGIYRFNLKSDAPAQVLEQVATLSLRSPVTGADASADGKWLAVMTYTGPTLYQIDGDVTRASAGQVWSAIYIDPSVEAVCFMAGGLLATTEGRSVVFFPVPQLRGPATRPAN
jgi:hypothetical protein